MQIYNSDYWLQENVTMQGYDLILDKVNITTGKYKKKSSSFLSQEKYRITTRITQKEDLGLL